MAFSPRGELHEWSHRVDKTLDKNHTDLKDPSLHPAIQPIAPARATRKTSKIIKEGTSALTPASSIKKIEDAWQREHQEWIEDSGKLDHLDSICRRLSREIHELDKKGADPSGLQSDQAKVLAALLRDKRARFAAEQESLLRENHELKQVKDRQKQYQLHQRGLLLRSSVLHYQNAMQ